MTVTWEERLALTDEHVEPLIKQLHEWLSRDDGPSVWEQLASAADAAAILQRWMQEFDVDEDNIPDDELDACCHQDMIATYSQVEFELATFAASLSAI